MSKSVKQYGCRLAAILTMLVIGLFAVVACATEFVPLTLNETVRRSDAILLGTVRAQQSRWGDATRRWLVTDYSFTVEEVLNGNLTTAGLADTVVLTFWGGAMGGETQSISDMRLPKVGERLVMMLRPNWNLDMKFTPVVGFNEGVFSVSTDVPGGPLLVRSYDGQLLTLTTNGAVVRQRDAATSGTRSAGVDLTVFTQWLRANAATIKSTASELPGSTQINDPRVIKPAALTPVFANMSGTDGAPGTVPINKIPRISNGAGVPIPAAPSSLIPRPVSASTKAASLQSITPHYSSSHQAHLPIVVNNLPDSFTPWSPEDEYQMSKWNYYATEVFRVYTTPTGDYGWPNDRFDLAGWPSSADLQTVYGTGWDATTLGVTIYRTDSNGWIIEADIALNPAYSWTLDDEWVYDGGPAIGFRQTMTHELGHMHGLEHHFDDLSVMNYPPSEMRAFSMPFSDDAQGVRVEYPSQAVSLTDLAVYLFYSSGYQSWTDATIPSSVVAGSALVINNYHIENVGTTTINTPTIEWYLTTARNFSGAYYYLGNSTYSSLPPFSHFNPSSVQLSFTVPASIPVGQYFLAAFIRNDAGVAQSSFPFDNNHSFSRLPIAVAESTTPPSNDTCSGAAVLTPGVPITLNTGNATGTGDPTPSCGSSVDKGVWFSFTSGISGQATISSCGSSFDSVVSVYSGTCAAPVSLGCIDDDGPSCAGTAASLTFNAVGGTTYRVFVGGYSGASGSLTIQGTVVPSVEPDIRIVPFSLNFIEAPLVGSGAVAAMDGNQTTAGLLPVTATNLVDKMVNPNDLLGAFGTNAKANKDGTVRVTVNLAVPLSVQSDVDFKSRPSVAALHGKVKVAQDAVLEKLSTSLVKVRHRFENIPAFSADVTSDGLQALLADPRVQSVEPVYELKPHLAQGIPLIGGDAYRGLYDGAGVAIAICDTGVDYTHPRLGGGGFPNAKVVGGYDFGDNDPDPAPGGEAHGTSCAGIAAGNIGTDGDYIGGVAPGAKLYALKITSGASGSATSDAMVKAWDWSVTHRNDDPANPIKVISTSFGGGKYFASCDGAVPSMTAAANNAVAAGISLFVSSGNDGYCNAVAWPSCISSVTSVGAVYDAGFGAGNFCISADSCASKIATTGCDTGYSVSDATAADKVTSYSNMATFLGVLAPGNQSYTLDIVGSGGYSSGNYATSFGGTSAACPYTAGSAAALQSAAKALTGSFLAPQVVQTALMETGNAVTDGKVAITKPRVNLARAIDTLQGNKQRFRIYNDGGGTLTVQGITPQTPATWLSFQPLAPFTVAPGSYQDVTVTVDFTSAPAGVTSTRLLVTSNDSNESPYPDGVNIAVTRPVVNGVCGTANTGGFAVAPTSNLCSSGTPDPAILSGTGPWTWGCKGNGTGSSNESCRAELKVTAPVLAGSNVPVTPTPSVNLVFTTVTAPGTIQVLSTSGPGTTITIAADDFSTIPGTSYDITSTAATVGLTTVCIAYNQASLGVSESILRLLHNNGTTWEDITTSTDTVNDKVCGETASLSPFVIGYRKDLKPGDCDGDGSITIDEVQNAINMYLGLKASEVCVDINSDSVTIDEVQKVINGYLGL